MPHYFAKTNQSRIYIASFGIIFTVALSAPVIAWANSVVSQGYTTDSSNITPGTLMGVAGNSGDAEPANSHGKYQLLGLVANKPLLALNQGKNQVQIVVTGTSDAIVSDINGVIKAGDKIAASPVTGVGMKATDAGQIVGTAQQDLNTNSTTTITVKDADGISHSLHVGTVALQVSIGYYAGAANQGALASVLPSFVTQTANGIAGNQVSPLRVLIALMALVIGFVIAGIMLQSAVRSGMISIGRNPLAKQALRRELLDVIATSLGVLLLTLTTIYLLLKI